MKPKIFFTAGYILGALLLAIMFVFAPVPQTARACEPTLAPPDYVPPTPIPIATQVAGVIQDTQIVLDGTVASWVPGADMNSILKVDVTQYLKGHGPKTVRISGYFWDCAPNFAFNEGARAIFFVNGDPTSTEPLQIRTWYAAEESVANSVLNFTGQKPAPPDSINGVLSLSLLAIIVVGFVLFIRYRRMP